MRRWPALPESDDCMRFGIMHEEKNVDTGEETSACTFIAPPEASIRLITRSHSKPYQSSAEFAYARHNARGSSRKAGKKD